jgi:hypothetical protein
MRFNVLDILLMLLVVYLTEGWTDHTEDQHQSDSKQAKLLHGIHGNSFNRN